MPEQAASFPAAEGGLMGLFDGASIDSVINLQSLNPFSFQGPDKIFEKMNAFNSTLTQIGEQVCDFLGTSHPKGEQIPLNLGAGEINTAQAPTVASDLGVKPLGLGGP